MISKKTEKLIQRIERVTRDGFKHMCWQVTLVVEFKEKTLMFEFMGERQFGTKEAAERWMSFSCPPFDKYADWFTDREGGSPLKIKWVPERYQFIRTPAGYYRDSITGSLLKKESKKRILKGRKK